MEVMEVAEKEATLAMGLADSEAVTVAVMTAAGGIQAKAAMVAMVAVVTAAATAAAAVVLTVPALFAW